MGIDLKNVPEAVEESYRVFQTKMPSKYMKLVTVYLSSQSYSCVHFSRTIFIKC